MFGGTVKWRLVVIQSYLAFRFKRITVLFRITFSIFHVDKLSTARIACEEQHAWMSTGGLLQIRKENIIDGEAVLPGQALILPETGPSYEPA